jgi:hypothetical protein
VDGPASGCGVVPLLLAPDLFLPILSIVWPVIDTLQEIGPD